MVCYTSKTGCCTSDILKMIIELTSVLNWTDIIAALLPVSTPFDSCFPEMKSQVKKKS